MGLRVSNIILLTVIFLSVLWLPLLGQQPMLETYGIEDYNANERNWHVDQNGLGMMFFGNQEGLLMYDGSNWRTFNPPGRTVRAVSVDANDNVFVGTLSDIGVIAQNARNEYVYRSLRPFLPDTTEAIKPVFEIKQSSNFSFVETQSAIYRIKAQNSSFEITKIESPGYVIGTSVANDQLHVITDEYIYLLEEDSLLQSRSTGYGNGDSIIDLHEIGGGKILAITHKSTILYFENGLNDEPVIWNRELQDYIDSEMINFYFGTKNIDHTYFGHSGFVALPTTSHGLLITTRTGKLVFEYNTDNGLFSNTIYDVFVDRESNIWMAGNKGIAKVMFNLPFYRYDEHSGLDTPVLSVEKLGSKTYAGTNNGLFVLDDLNSSFQRIGEVGSQFWQLTPYKKGVLAAAGNEGVIYVEGNRIVDHKATSVSTMSILAHPEHEEIVFAGLFDGLHVFRHDANGFSLVTEFPAIRADIRSMAFDDRGQLWAGSSFSGFTRLTFDESVPIEEAIRTADVTTFDVDSGFNAKEHNKVVPTVEGLLFTTRNRIYRFDHDTERFEPHPAWMASNMVYPDLYSDRFGRTWLKHERRALESADKKAPAISLEGVLDAIYDVRTINENELLVGSNNGLFYLDLNRYGNEREPKLLLCKVTTQNQAIPVYRIPNSTNFEPITWRTNDESVQVEVTLPFYHMEERTEYRYRIDGVDTEWRPWSQKSIFEIDPLWEGSYELHAQAKNVRGVITSQITMPFTITPPWYRTYWAYGSYVFAIGLVIWGIVNIYNFRLRKQNLYLESLVRTRTDEIASQNQTLRDQAVQLREANEFKLNLLNMAAHDIRNPLGVIIGISDLIQSDEDNPEITRNYATEIERVSQNMLKLIGKLLNSDTGNSSTLPGTKEQVQLDELLNRIIEQNRILAAQKKQRITAELESPIQVFADRDQLAEAIDNVINNAVKYSPHEGLISVSLSIKADGERSVAELRVSDEGPGIKPAYHSTIFEKHGKGEAEPTGNEISTGLGLNIVKQILESMDGTITVTSDPQSGQKGSTFTIRLPLRSNQ